MTRLPTIDEARERILARVGRLGDETVPLGDALHRVLAEDVRAANDVPPFANSAMDGFALIAGPAGRRLEIVGESRAGVPAHEHVGDGTAIRISTGAALPDGADAVVMVERTTEDGSTVLVEAATTVGQNVRRAGEDVVAGTVVLAAGTKITAAELGVAATAGRADLRCARRPRVAILATGDELVPLGRPLAPGQIHDSNALTLAALAAEQHALVVGRGHVPDDRGATETAIAGALADADLLILSGGVSVGPHDHVKPALLANGVEEVLWRVALRPGKPTWFGVRDTTLVFGLPGNPVSAMVTFLLFVKPAIARLQGADPTIPREQAVLTEPVAQTEQRDEMIRVQLDGDRATPTGPQGSHQLTSMLGADALALVPAGSGELAAGTRVVIERL